jgi:DNA-binding MarR family transcriptional regulator
MLRAVRTRTDVGALASDLRLVLGQLVRRLRAEHRFPLTQSAVLGRLDREGTSSIGALALAERVRPQSMAQTVADLQEAGLIARRADPSDGRRTLIELTERGKEALEGDRRNRDGWLARAIAEDLSEDEQALLAQALTLLRRIADA